MGVSGVSPIRLRHEIDLYGTKIGIGKHNPIMVENLYRFPDPHEFEHPDALEKMKGVEHTKAAAPNDKTPKPKAAKTMEKKTPSKLVLTNKNRGP